MNKDNAKDFLPLVQALADGKEIQIKGADGNWKDCNPTFSVPADNYRIKPEPREIYVIFNESGCVVVSCKDKDRAQNYVLRYPAFTYKKFVEEM